MQERHKADVALGRRYATLTQCDLGVADFSGYASLPHPVGILVKGITPSGSVGVKAVFCFYTSNREGLPLEFD